MHNKNVYEDILMMLKSINNKILFKHEELINEIVTEIDNDANLELNESSDYIKMIEVLQTWK